MNRFCKMVCAKRGGTTTPSDGAPEEIRTPDLQIRSLVLSRFDHSGNLEIELGEKIGETRNARWPVPVKYLSRLALPRGLRKLRRHK